MESILENQRLDCSLFILKLIERKQCNCLLFLLYGGVLVSFANKMNKTTFICQQV